MATLKEFRNMVWQREFDIADEETNLRVQRIQRVRRAAASRSSSTADRSALPVQVTSPNTKGLGAAAAHVPNMTRHGLTRLRQRGITIDQVVTLLDLGNAQRSHGPMRRSAGSLSGLDAYSTSSRTPLRSDGGRHSTVMADTVPG